MNHRVAWAAVALAVMALTSALILLRPKSESTVAEPDVAEPSSLAVPEEGDQAVTVELFFPGEDDRLHIEERQLPVAEDARDAVSIIARAVLDGPQDPELLAVFPPDVRLGAVDIDGYGTAFVGLESELLAAPPIVGSNMEMLTLYSLVNSVVLNVDRVRALVLLWNGQQLATLAGHIDTRHPVEPRTDLWPDPRDAGALGRTAGDRRRREE